MSYGLTTPDDMAEHIKKLEKACREWSEVSQKNYQRAKAAEAKLAAEEQKGYANAMETERKIHEERIEELEAKLAKATGLIQFLDKEYQHVWGVTAKSKVRTALAELRGEDRG